MITFNVKLQEFSYDTLKSVKSQELTVPSSLAVILPQDYVNYVRVSFIDQLRCKKNYISSKQPNYKPI